MKALTKYLAITRTQIINSAAYPFDLATRSLMIVMFMFIFAQLWKATYSALGQSSIAGLSVNDTMWYMMIAETIVLSKPRLTNTIAEQVKEARSRNLSARRCFCSRSRSSFSSVACGGTKAAARFRFKCEIRKQ